MHLTTHPELNHKPRTPPGVGAPEFIEHPFHPHGGPAISGRSPVALLSELAGTDSRIEAIQVPQEILELAEEIVSRAEAPGIEHESLLLMLRAVIFLDRQARV